MLVDGAGEKPAVCTSTRWREGESLLPKLSAPPEPPGLPGSPPEVVVHLRHQDGEGPGEQVTRVRKRGKAKQRDAALGQAFYLLIQE